ncbi:hypothetical protein KIN_03970 [Litoreibacter roseus]|uniref:Haem-binding uptake Tiki superfamily ChaN domain-containing protein n=1 Tax=Litoreibacter roseus TaxID=2601869 RepID=A0A6N6JAQ3_9RHOB|nr:hypothetical protein KIN_03970 [Litoreibacter roseus]
MAFSLCPQILSADVLETSALSHLPDADIYLLGELHDNEIHHENQATAVAAIEPKALVFEMLSPDQASAAVGIDRSDEAALGAALNWADSGWPEFGYYYPIFAAAPDAQIYGAAVPRDDVRRALEDGAAAVFGEDAGRFGLSDPLEQPEQEMREDMQQTAHCNALPPEMLPGMVEAQRLRDGVFSKTALQALEDTGGPVVVITGNGHARADWGMPRYFRAAAPEVTLLSLGQIIEAEDNPPFDYWLITADTRDPEFDPCAAFKSN